MRGWISAIKLGGVFPVTFFKMKSDHSEQLIIKWRKVGRLVLIGVSPIAAFFLLLLIVLGLSRECALIGFGAKRAFVTGQVCQTISNIFLPEKEPLPTPSLAEQGI
ncbi:hypothetical protein [Gloeothece verrucosa]|uniref:hypothetical protein n=1 Tax=Gloeothece verrucosa TaxID=2546359 RepID=UPI0002D5594C|nr:hypothetical protein [Gloeothece verrucosa]